MKHQFIISIVLGLMLTGCSTISTLQSAKPTDEGKMSHRIAIGTLSATASAAAGVKVENKTIADTISVPTFEYMFRYGLGSGMDFGLRTSGFAHGGDFKWNFVSGDKFLMSTGLALSHLSYEITSGSTTTKVTSTDVIVPLYMDYVASDSITLYGVPKYLMRSVSATTSETINFTGASLGLKWGKEKGLLLEYTLMTGKDDADNTIDMNQLAIGYFF